MAQLRYAIAISTAIALTSLGASKAGDKATATKYRDLIEQLVSPNEKPTTDNNLGEGTVKLPKRYDVAAQQEIDKARKELQVQLEEALPYLIEALDDERYCMTINWGDGDAYYNRSVGQICREIIASHLELYRDKVGFGSARHWHRYTYPEISKEWWEERKDKGLAELQVEAIDWAIAKRTADDDMDQREERRQTEVAALVKLRDEIAESKTPVKPRRLLPMQTRNVQ